LSQFFNYINKNKKYMKQTKMFLKSRKEVPADEITKNATLLIKAGYVYKEMPGVYAYLPMGIKVVEKIKQIAREEMNAAGGNELIMTNLQRKELWEKTDRWDDEKVDVWFKSKLKNETEIGFAWSHEEPITNMMTDYVQSYRDLPQYVYQFQTKLRNETRAKSGIMRGREFVMKDLYSYTTSDAEHEKFYNKMIQSYLNFYRRVGVGDETFLVAASGGAFTKNISHEFQTITDAGEDIIYVDKSKMIGVNSEVIGDELALQKVGIKKEDLEEVKTSEVGNIFSFGAEKSEKLDLYFTDTDGTKKPVILGSYGIGITRIMGVIVEKFADDKGLVWPKNISPFQVHLVSLHKESGDTVYQESESIYNKLTEVGYEVLWDDRMASPGVKLNDADLFGISLQVVVGEKGLAEGSVEVKYRKTGEVVKVPKDAICDTMPEIWQKAF
jgi:prolyl-tRNA synthetase